MNLFKRTGILGAFFLIHGAAQATESDDMVNAATDKASLLLNVRDIQGNNVAGRCSKLLQNCVVIMETDDKSSTISVVNNSSVVAHNIQVHFPEFAPAILQDGGCMKPLAPGASCTITLTINGNISGFTLPNVPIYGSNTAAVYFNIEAIQLG